MAELLIFFLFLCSGFCGLIYESIWTHYLKLIFGHAAYAQSLVLSIFMGGLAIGAYLTSYLSPKVKHPLLAYAIIEATIGLFAIFFHDVFIYSNDILFNQLAPSIDSSLFFNILKWSLGTSLILPQSILLGTTFPLISKAILEISPQQSGRKISLLYFNNSFGAAIGALVSGFYLVQNFGLPGTIQTAGIINVFIAIAVLLILNLPSVNKTHRISESSISKDKLFYLLIGTSFFTGVASFFYEIAWIRMLTLVLGATTHAFELMISAFILGLALGSFWIKKHIDKFKSPVVILVYVQILMATFAFGTIFSYDSLFDVMEYIFKSISRNNEGYNFYLFINHLLALVIMLPASIFAGMTLPLITNILLRRQTTTKVIGYTYAFNTLGAITGVVIAMNLLLPLIGTKNLVIFGGLIDICIGLILLGFLYHIKPSKNARLQFFTTCAVSFILFQVTFYSNTFEPLKTSAGVFRTGVAKFSDGTKVLFHKDGKLSTVDVTESKEGHVIISNNGKPDAAVNLYGSVGGIDEVTMILLGVLPLSVNPNISTVANIGMGAGQTLQTLLSHPNIKRIDTIEIEKSVIEALPYFKIYSQLPRYDSRSKIIIDDAKTFFASSNIKYDLIVSEPPNLWVSGVSSLFTTEFYSQIKKKLSTQGIFTQWLHLYEVNIQSIASIFNALSDNFENYVLYNTDDGNVLIIASDKMELDKLNNKLLSNNKIQKLLQRIQSNSLESFQTRYIGDKELLEPLFHSLSTGVANDYFPSLSYDAAKSLFLKENSTSITGLHHFPVPINQMLENNIRGETLNIQNGYLFSKQSKVNTAKAILHNIVNNKPMLISQKLNLQLTYSINLITQHIKFCSNNSLDDSENSNLIINSAYQLASATMPYLGINEKTQLWNKIINSLCYKRFSPRTKNWITLHKAIAIHDFNGVFKLSTQLFKAQGVNNNKELREYLFSSVLVSAFKLNNKNTALTYWKKYFNVLYPTVNDIPMSLQLLHAHITN